MISSAVALTPKMPMRPFVSKKKDSGYKFYFLDGHIKFRFSNEEDMYNVLNKGPWTVVRAARTGEMEKEFETETECEGHHVDSVAYSIGRGIW